MVDNCVMFPVVTCKMTDYCVMREIFRNFGLFYLNHFWLGCYLEKFYEDVAVTSEITKKSVMLLVLSACNPPWRYFHSSDASLRKMIYI